MSSADHGLVVRRTIRATPERLFAAWTEPDQLLEWWGPAGVECVDAQVDLRPGGEYRIANRFPDGHVVWISGRFESVEPPHRLTYSWTIAPDATSDASHERVTVRFEPIGSDTTSVVVIHERIASDELRRGHEVGWLGCLDGLESLIEAERRADRRP